MIDIKRQSLVLPYSPLPVGVMKQMYPPPADCVLHLTGYPPGGATITDFSGQGNHGTISGATWARWYSGLRYLSLDGDNDSVLLNSRTGIPGGNNAWTYLAWVYPTSFATEARTVLATGAGATRQMAVVNFTTTTGVLAWYSYGDDFTVTGLTGVLNTWQLVGVIYDGARGQTLYLAGNSATNTLGGDLALPTTGNNSKVYIGRHNFGSGDIQNFAGYMALERFFTTSLSVATIDSIRARERHLFGV